MSIDSIRPLVYILPEEEAEGIDPIAPEPDEAEIYAVALGIQIETFKSAASGRTGAGDKAINVSVKAQERLKGLGEAILLSKKVNGPAYPGGTQVAFPKEAAQCVGTRAVLQFKANNKPKLLYVSSSADCHGTTSPSRPENCARLRKLNATYNMKYLIISKVDELYKELEKYPKSSISGIVFNMHGDRNAVYVGGEPWDGEVLNLKAVNALKDKAFIHLISCATGHTADESPLYKMRDSLEPLGKKIFLTAPSQPVLNSSVQVSRTMPLSIKYTFTEGECRTLDWVSGTFIPCHSLPKDEANPERLNVTQVIETKGK